MILNDAGIVANECWSQIPNHFPNVVLHAYVIMPNHIHGIIELTNDAGGGHVGVQNFELQYIGGNHVGVQNFEPLQSQKQNEFQKIIPRSIGSIVRGFKIGVTKWFRKNTGIQCVWERNYYEHIIRDDQSFQTITEYIINNPRKWDEDKFFFA